MKIEAQDANRTKIVLVHRMHSLRRISRRDLRIPKIASIESGRTIREGGTETCMRAPGKVLARRLAVAAQGPLAAERFGIFGAESV